MDLFEKNLQDIEKRYTAESMPESSENETAEDIRENAESAEAPEKAIGRKGDFDDIFWGSVMEASYKRQARVSGFLKTVCIAFLSVLILFFMTTMMLGKGWISSVINRVGDRISFTLPLYEPPKLDESYYMPDGSGRYTTEGLAKALSPSVVSVVVYYDVTPMTVIGGSAQGSGIIISEDGYIVTNAHVVDNSPLLIKVILHDDTPYAARVVGSDPKTDIAVLKIEAKGLSPAVFADSDSVSPGEDVVAIGSPAGLYGSITKGVVSAVGREIRTDIENLEMECIQIDAAINPGNSGGALFNMWGQVVGIISSKLSATYYDGIGFAISTKAAKPIIEELMEFGSIQNRVRIGISFVGVDELAADSYGYPCAGLYIASIDENCDISNTELLVGDFITHINGKKVTSLSETMAAVSGMKPGDEVTADVVRIDPKGGTTNFKITFKLEKDDTATQGFVEKED